jgi:hypothetical protein
MERRLRKPKSPIVVAVRVSTPSETPSLYDRDLSVNHPRRDGAPDDRFSGTAERMDITGLLFRAAHVWTSID